MAPGITVDGGGLSMLRLLHQLITDERGTTAIEYALIASLISVLIFGGSFTMGTTLRNTFSTVAAAL
jgi:pilus assembly protein Flp/PilA